MREQLERDTAATTDEAVRHRTEKAHDEQRRMKAERRKKLAKLKERRALARAKINRRERERVRDDYEPRHYEVESQRVGLFGSRSGFGFFGD
jgi:hypothetical protein